MNRRHSFWALVFLLGTMLSAAGPAQAQTGGLRGQVRDAEGKPLAGATIVFERTDIKQRFQVKTNKKGSYVHASLPAGFQTRYVVRVIYEGQTIFEVSDVNVPLGGITDFDIDLKKEREQQERQLNPEQRQQLEEQRKKKEEFKSLEQHFNAGREYLQQKKFVEAAAEFEAAATLDPTQPAVYFNLARAYTALNQDDKAIEAYEKAIELKPAEAAYHLNLGGLYAKQGRTDEARQAYESAIELNPEMAGTAYFNLGVILYNNNKLKAAIEPLRKSTELDPSRAEAFYLLGMCLYNSAEYKMEGGEYETILQPGTRESFERYLALKPNGRFAKSAKDMLQAIDLTVPAAVRVKKK